MQENKDEELYKLFLSGNKNAFNEIAVKYQNRLINFIFAYVHNLEVAEDLAQDTFLYLIVNKTEYDFKYTLKTYLYTIAKCRAINYLRRQRKRIEFSEVFLDEIEEDFDRNILKEDNIKIVRKCVKSLKQEYKIAIYLRDFQNFEYKEICKILNKDMYKVKSLIHRARKTLKKKIEKEGYKYEI